MSDTSQEPGASTPAAGGTQDPNPTAEGAPNAQPGDGKQTDTKSADAKASEGEGAKAPEGEAKPAAPEDYTFKTPDGVDLDPESTGGLKALAKELGLSQENAQKGVDLMVAAVDAKQLEERSLAVAYGNLSTMYAEQGDEAKSQTYAEMASRAEASGAKLR